MTPIALWRYEVRRTGWAAMTTPPVTASLVVALAVLQSGAATHTAMTARTLLAVLEMGIPLAAGVGAASLFGTDPAVELQLCVVRSYRTTMLRRLAITLGWGAVVAVAASSALVASGWWQRWPLAQDPLIGQLTWLSPMLWLGGLGFLLGAWLRGPAAAGGVVAGVWFLQQLMADSMQAQPWTRPLFLFATTRGGGEHWLANRLTLVGTAVVLVVAGWLVASRAGRLLEGDDG